MSNTLGKVAYNLAKQNALLFEGGSEVSTSVINTYNPALTNSSMAVGDTRLINSTLIVGDTIQSISVECSTAGAIVFKLASQNADGTFNLVKDIPATLVLGVNIITVNELITLPNCYIGMFNPTGGAIVTFVSSANILFTHKITGELTGINKSVVAYTNTTVMALAITMKHIGLANNVVQNNKDLNDILSQYDKTSVLNSLKNTQNLVTLDGTSKLDKYSLLSTTFPSLPANWVNTGSWTFAGGLKSPVTGGTTVQCYSNTYSTLDRHTMRARVKVNNITSSFGLMKRHSLHGGLGLISFSSMKLKLYRAYTGGALPVENLAVNITIPIVLGREYIVTYSKDACIHTLSIQDAMTGESNVAVFDNSTVTNTNYCGKQWGGTGFLFMGGDILIKKFDYICNAPKNPKVLILGDSITEGFLLDNNTATYTDRWCHKVREKLNGNCVISGRGSGDTADLITKLAEDLDRFLPKYVVIAIGTNDIVLNGNVAPYLTNMPTIISRVLAVGAIPILVAPCTYGGANMAMMQQEYDYVNAQPYSVVHFNYAVSLNHDGITHDGSLSIDGVHPTKAGHLAMFNQFLIDAPEVFE